MPVRADTMDVPTLAFLAGVAANEYLLQKLRDRGVHLRNAHGYVIQHLVEGEPTIGDLAERLEVTQQAASKTVLELEDLGYVKRISDPADARIRRVALTRAGTALLAKARADRAQLEATLSGLVGPRAIADARKVLITLLEQTGNLDAIQNRSAKPPSD